MSAVSSSSTSATTATPPVPGRAYSLLALGGYAAVISASAVVFQYWQAEPVPEDVYLLGMGLLALCLLPLALWQAGARSGAPMFELLCVAYAIAYAIPVFLHENSIRVFNTYSPLDWVTMRRALEITILGITAMIGGYYLAPQSPLSRWLPRADLPMKPGRFFTFLFIAFGVAGGLQMINQATAGSLAARLPGQLFSLFTFVTGAGIALLAFRVFSPGAKSPPHLKVILYGVVAAFAMIGAGTGMLEAVFTPMLVLLAARWSARQRVPIVWLLVGWAAILVMNSAKADYRNEVWFAEKIPTVTEQLAVWMDKSSAVVKSLSTSDGLNDAVVRTVHRFDMIHIFAHVLGLTPGELPFYEGASYSYLFYGWIPRAIWPDKPIAQEANVMFALDYGLLVDSQRDTTRMGIGFLTEAYANFGVWGVMGVMFLIGWLFGAIGMVFNGPLSDGGRATYVVVFAFFMNGLGSATTMFFFLAIQGFIALPIILRYFATSWRAPVAPLPSAASPGEETAGHA
ncbi:MAG: hypothetical protein HZA92_08695 [Verrucomicrobia bacterium]|nr:hypothetical protein [Verrucomicrobiota bacterium]